MRLFFGVLLCACVAFSYDAQLNQRFQAQLLEAKEHIPTLSSDQLFQKIKAQEAFILLDVREKDEVEANGAPLGKNYLHVSRGKLEFSLVGLGLGPQDAIVVMCRNSIRSFLAAKTLREYGFENITVLDRGMDGWVGRGYPTRNPFAP